MSVCCLLFFRVQRKVLSLCVYREGGWLRLEGAHARFDSINILVMFSVNAAVPIPIGYHVVRASFRYPVYSSKYYKSNHMTVNPSMHVHALMKQFAL